MKKILFGIIVIYNVLIWSNVIKMHGYQLILSYLFVGVIGATFNYLTAQRRKKVWGVIGFLIGNYGVATLLIVNIYNSLSTRKALKIF